MLQNCHKPHFSGELLGDAKAQNSSARSASADPGGANVDGDLSAADDFQELDVRAESKAACRIAAGGFVAAVTAASKSSTWTPRPRRSDGRNKTACRNTAGGF
jgi:hypothetical protein